MTEEQKQELLDAIRKQNIQIGKTDPLFAVITALEFVTQRYLKEVDLLMIRQSANYETTTVRYLDKAKELAEVKISHAVEEVLIRMDDYKVKVIEDLKTETPKAEIPTVFWVLLGMTGVMSIAAGYMVALLILT